MQELIERYLGYLKMRNCSPKTIRTYKVYLKVISQNFTRPEDINIGNVAKVTEEKKWSKMSIRMFIALCSSFCSFLVNDGVINRNPFQGFPTQKLQNGNGRTFILTDAEISHVILSAEKNLSLKGQIMIRLLSETGMRADELLNIQVKYVDLQNRGIYLETTKGSRPRTVFFSQHTATLLKQYLPGITGQDSLFPAAYYAALNQMVKTIICIAFPFDRDKQNEVTPHTFRHSFATSWLQSNRHPVVLKRIMGWQSLNMLNVYEHLRTENLMTEYREYEQANKRG